VSVGKLTSKSLSKGARLLRVHLTVDDPRCSIPRGSVKGSPEVEEKHRGNASSWKGAGFVGVVGWVGDLDVCCDYPHAYRTSRSANHEKLSASEIVDKPEKPDKSESSLHDAEDACGEEAGVCSYDSEALEHSGAVVVDCVDA
jgi:hypothetical protein